MIFNRERGTPNEPGAVVTLSLTMQRFQSDDKDFELNAEVRDKRREKELYGQKEDQGRSPKNKVRATMKEKDKWPLATSKTALKLRPRSTPLLPSSGHTDIFTRLLPPSLCLCSSIFPRLSLSPSPPNCNTTTLQLQATMLLVGKQKVCFFTSTNPIH